jgi:fructosamine-3-kinase
MSTGRLATVLSDRVGGTWRVHALDSSAFCRTFRADASDHAPLFVKTLPSGRAEVLHAEADGLRALVATRTIRVPLVVDEFEHDGVAVLAMEWLVFAPATSSPLFAERFGRALASLHRAVPPGEGRFGWHRDNWLGGTPQRNTWSAGTGRDGWLAFLAERRLLPMAEGLGDPLVAAVRRVVDVLPRLFDADGQMPRPSLIHGDLWSGNWASLGAAGEPVIFDPAVSVSDAEAELAMMELFGSPPAGFWPAYRELMPVSPGYPRRRPVYQLVHLLNHARLFGGGYGQQALAVAQAVLRGI